MTPKAKARRLQTPRKAAEVLRRRRLRVPEEHEAALAFWLGLGRETRKRVQDALARTPASVYLEDFAKSLASRCRLPLEEVDRLVRLFAGLYVAFDRYEGTSKSFAHAVASATKQLQNPSLEPAGGEWGEFEGDLERIVSMHRTLGLTSKALDLLTTFPNLYCRSRIISDLRPVFTHDLRDEPAGLILAHSLKIAYHPGRSEDPTDMFVAMDRGQLAELRDVINRALNKDASLRRLAKNRNLRLLEEAEQDAD